MKRCSTGSARNNLRRSSGLTQSCTIAASTLLAEWRLRTASGFDRSLVPRVLLSWLAHPHCQEQPTLPLQSIIVTSGSGPPEPRIRRSGTSQGPIRGISVDACSGMCCCAMPVSPRQPSRTSDNMTTVPDYGVAFWRMAICRDALQESPP